MDYKTIVVEVKEKTLWIGLNRPRTLNAINFQMLDETIHALTRLDEDSDIGVGVLYGLGGNFCSGGDMDVMLGLDARNRAHLEQ